MGFRDTDEMLRNDDVVAFFPEIQQQSQRKARLFSCACCKAVVYDRVPLECRLAIDAAELFADGKIRVKDLLASRRAALPHVRDSVSTPGEYTAIAVSRRDSRAAWVLQLVRRFANDDLITHQRTIRLFNDIFGNPFRPITFDPRWRSSAVFDLSESIYEERAFDRIPILADALMDAGCANDDIIQHCRGPGPHVKGCWVVDLILGKE